MRILLSLSVTCCLLFRPGTDVRADHPPELVAIIDKALKATGGEEKSSKFKALTCRLTDGNNESTRLYFQGCDQMRIEVGKVLSVEGISVMVFNRDKSWGAKKGKVQEFPEGTLSEIKDMIHAIAVADLLAALKGKDYTLAPLAEVKIDGKAAVGMRVKHKSRTEVRLFFDKESGLPIKSEIRVKRGENETSFECCYVDYKEVDGIRHFTKFRTVANGNTSELHLSDIKLSEKLDAALFEKPK